MRVGVIEGIVMMVLLVLLVLVLVLCRRESIRPDTLLAGPLREDLAQAKVKIERVRRGASRGRHDGHDDDAEVMTVKIDA